MKKDTKKQIGKHAKKAGGYAWNYLKMTGLFPNFKKKGGKKDE